MKFPIQNSSVAISAFPSIGVFANEGNNECFNLLVFLATYESLIHHSMIGSTTGSCWIPSFPAAPNSPHRDRPPGRRSERSHWRERARQGNSAKKRKKNNRKACLGLGWCGVGSSASRMRLSCLSCSSCLWCLFCFFLLMIVPAGAACWVLDAHHPSTFSYRLGASGTRSQQIQLDFCHYRHRCRGGR